MARVMVDFLGTPMAYTAGSPPVPARIVYVDAGFRGMTLELNEAYVDGCRFEGCVLRVKQTTVSNCMLIGCRVEPLA